MKKSIRIFAVALFVILFAGAVKAQLSGIFTIFQPANPTSADSITLGMQDGSCGGDIPFIANPYTLSMSQNNLTIMMGTRVSGRVKPSPCPPGKREEFDLGRLPAGNYTVSVVEPAMQGAPSRVVFSNFPLTVTDAHATKVAPYVRLDYSGQWWDPSDPGWGLFIWHDARDAVLAAWFTYTPDGKPMWYTFQPVFNTSSATRVVDLLQTSRAPGPTSPPPGPNTYAVIGSASLDFAHYDYLNNGDIDTGILTYTFTGGAKLVRNIRRFKP